MSTPLDRYVTYDHQGLLTVRYWDEGQGGDPILLIHGLGSYCEVWDETVPALARRHRVLALDLPGHGHSDKPIHYSYRIADLAESVRRFLAALNVPRVHVIGHSLGGAVAIYLALQAPEYVDRLALIASAGFGSEGAWALRLATVPGLGEWLLSPSPARSAAAAHSFLARTEAGTAERVHLHYTMAARPGVVRATLQTARANGSVFGQRASMVRLILSGARALNQPTLVLWGDQDKILPVRHAHVAARTLPQSRLHVLHSCGHVPMIEHPAACNRLHLDFFETPPLRPQGRRPHGIGVDLRFRRRH